MSHYEERLAQDLEEIRNRVTAVATQVEGALHKALRALLTLDSTLAYQTILADNPINRTVESIDKLCHYFIARHLPSAGHLRFISSVMRMNIELERMGDYAVTICREVAQLSRPLEGDFRSEVELMAEHAFDMFHQAIQAFETQNVELARSTMGYGKQVDRTFSLAFDTLLEQGQEKATKVGDLLSKLTIINMLERVSDQAKNLCEGIDFALTGNTKQRKPVDILFLDETDDFRTQMAVAIGRKTFPNAGRFSSAGLKPAPAVDATMHRFMEAHGYDLDEATPKTIDWPPETWKSYKVIVSLHGPINKYLSNVPFNTVALHMEVPAPLYDTADENQAQARIEEIYRDIAAHITDLMKTLRGEDAS